jgi:transposase-like protein
MPSKNHTHQQYFLFSAKARSLSIPQVAEWDEETVFKAFRDMRWAKTGGGLYCPKCGSVAHYFSKRRRQWRCKDCGHTYSVASGTWLHSTNLPLRTILIAILLLANGAKGISALQLGRDIGVQYKTAFTLYHKLRSASQDPVRQACHVRRDPGGRGIPQSIQATGQQGCGQARWRP